MRVLGIDPGLTRCGLGVIDSGSGQRLDMVDVLVVGTQPTTSLGRRLIAIEQAVDECIDRHQPDAVALEQVFSQHNVRTVMGVAQASGVIIATAARHGLSVALHTPSEVKASVTGHGRADKAQVAAMVNRLLRMSDQPRQADAFDALALAICHAWRGAAAQRLAEAAEAARR